MFELFFKSRRLFDDISCCSSSLIVVLIDELGYCGGSIISH